MPNARWAAADGRDGLDRRRVVEQRAAAAVDLGVDEAGHEQTAAEVVAVGGGRDLGVVDHGRDAARFDDHGLARDELAVEQGAAVDERRRHSVSVTLVRCGGRSGSRPRASAAALAARYRAMICSSGSISG